MLPRLTFTSRRMVPPVIRATPARSASFVSLTYWAQRAYRSQRVLVFLDFGAPWPPGTPSSFVTTSTFNLACKFFAPLPLMALAVAAAQALAAPLQSDSNLLSGFAASPANPGTSHYPQRMNCNESCD